jgi:hypothetical protein
MRKLSMKKPGTPAIEEDSESGSGGVSAEGFGARLPRLGLLVVPPVEPLPAPPPSAPLDLPWAELAGRAPDELPWACWELTCGVVVVGALDVLGAGVLGVGELTVGLVAGAGVVGVVLASGVAGAGVVSGDGVVSPAVEVLPGSGSWTSTAGELAGSSSASATEARKMGLGSLLIASLSSPTGS